jgi:sec-independent protein translocase protein TatA
MGMGIGFWQLLLILIVVFVFFGAGRLPNVMGDIGKGIRNLRDGLKNDGDKDEQAKVEHKDNADVK